jgi:thioredoxin 2
MIGPVHVVCPHCDAVNRVPPERPLQAAKCGTCHKPLFTGAPLPVDGARFDRHLSRNDVPVVVDFWADWCAPCHAMAPVYARVCRDTEPAMRFLKLDTDKNPEIAARYAIRGIPTLIVFDQGKAVATRAGASDAASLKGWLAPFLRSAPA